MKIAVVTDSTSYIPKEQREALHIEMVPLNVIFGNESYQDDVEITIEEFYAKMKDPNNELPKTSQPAVGLFVECYEKLAKDYDAVIVITISQELSGTYQAAYQAGDMVEGIEVHVFDSAITATMQAWYVEEAAKMAMAGKSVEEILAQLNDMKKTMEVYIMVDDLAHLKRGGRLSGAQALIGSMLQIKPILRLEGKVIPFEKVRTHKKALKRIQDIFGEKIQGAKKVKAVVVHGNRPEEAETLRNQLDADYPNAEVEVSYIGPILATHLGEGTLAIGFYIVE